MGKDVHMGDFVRDLLDRRKQVHSRVARAAGMSPTNFSDMLRRARIGDAILHKVGMAMGVDLVQLVRLSLDGGDELHQDPWSVDSEPAVQHEGKAVVNKAARTITIDLDAFDEEVQLKILRFLQQQPRK